MADILNKTVNTPVGDTPVIPVLVMVTGAYLAWFGVHYWRSDTKWPTDPIKAVLQGKAIPVPDRTKDNAALLAVGTAASAAAAAGSAAAAAGNAAGSAVSTPTQSGHSTNIQIASDAMTYIGQGYVWGGSADKPGNWDCSSFVSYVLGHDLGISLPGGKWGDPGFPPNAHGPTTLDYMLFGKPITDGQEQAGDLVVSNDHIGICIGGGQYVSARTPSLGVGVDKLSDPFPGGLHVFRRVL